jgi:hypothetical protein
MALTLGRLVEDGERATVARLHYMLLLAGSLTTGLALFVVGALWRSSGMGNPALHVLALVVGAAVLVGWAAHVATGWGLPFPKPRWQVPEAWRYELPPRFTLGAYGYMLGLGVTTNPVFPTIWVLCVLTAAAPNAAVALLPWVLYAAVRTVTTALATRRAVCEVTIRPGRDPDVPMNSPRLFTMARAAVVALLLSLATAGFLNGL